MTQTPCFASLNDQGLIRASGEDAGSFLHNLLTNDIQHLDETTARHAGLCTPKGRLIATFLVWREAGDYYLMLSADILPGILKKLSMYVLRSKVKLADISGERILLGVMGARIGPEAPMAAAPLAGGTAIRLDTDRCVLAISRDEAAAVRSTPGLGEADLATWHLVEIRAGIPRIAAATQEAFVPQMVNYELPAVGGVSFQKGCYPGQEIVARTHYLGKVKRRMIRAKLETPFPPGTDVFTPDTGDQHCGAIVQTAPVPDGGWESLIVAQTTAGDDGTIHVGAPAGPVARPLPLPYAIE